jgi:diguanylate cyclase (GGDEF)-like protein
LNPGQQQELLAIYEAAYPDAVNFGTVAADGEPIARSDHRQGVSWTGDPVFQEITRTNQAAIAIRISPAIGRPVFTLAMPVRDAEGNFAGMVSASLESSRLALLLSRTDFGRDTVAYLVDGTGRIIAHPDPNLVASFADVSGSPSVASLLSDPAASGSLRVAGPRGGVLASYARVPGLGWGVVVEQPAAAGLEPIQTKLDLLFAGLLVLICLGAAFGVVAAGWLGRPLATLAVAVDRLATGDSSAPLPQDGLTEIVRLAATFSHLRKRLVARTAEREFAEEALKHQALHDALTGLPNRVLFTDRLEHALARSDRQTDSVAVLFLDLDRFKGINDSLGHEQGDTVLIAVAERLQTCMRSADTVARFGGDEFTILLEGNNGQEGAIGVAERIAIELARPIQLKVTDVVVRASIGIAMRGPASSGTQLLHEADLAMYRAKRKGLGSGYAVFEPELDVAPTKRTSRDIRQPQPLLAA